MRQLLCFLILLSASSPAMTAEASGLKVLLSIDQATVTSPFCARVMLHLHNAGKRTLRVYTPVRDASNASAAVNPFFTEAPGPGSTGGGSALEIHLVPLKAQGEDLAGEGRVLEVAGFSQPKLVALGPGEDYEEKTAVRLSPASGGRDAAKLLWGGYKLSVTYSASYSNGDDLNRILDANIWQGKVESNTLEVNLQPPAASSQGSVSGSVLGGDMQPTFGALVTLSNQQEQVLGQVTPDQNGKFLFAHLPFGFYWLTARSQDVNENTTVYQHAEISPADPAETVQLVMLRPEIDHARQLRHKPVLLRVLDTDDQPLADVSLQAIWSSGTLLETVKGRTGNDGSATLELLPGRNFLTLGRKGCHKQDERIDVTPGRGIDGFKLVSDCAKR
jgi:Carboxypeptidase regulatory-like domain